MLKKCVSSGWIYKQVHLAQWLQREAIGKRGLFKLRCLGVLWIGFIFNISGAIADVTFSVEHVTQPDIRHTTNLMIRGQQIRLGPVEGMAGFLLFNGQSKTIFQVLPDKQAYRVIDDKTFVQVGQALELLQAKLVAELDDLPVEQREQMKKALYAGSEEGEVAQGTGDALLKPTEQTREVLGRHCQVLEQRLPSGAIRQICLIAPEYFGIQTDELGVVQTFHQYISSVVRDMPGGQQLVEQLSFWGHLLKKIPLDVRRLSGQTLQSVYQMSDIKTGDLDPSLFSVPAGFRQIEATF